MGIQQKLTCGRVFPTPRTFELHWIQNTRSDQQQRHFTLRPKSSWLGFLSTPASMRFSVVPKDAWRLISCCSINVCFHVCNEGCFSQTSALLLEADPGDENRFTVFTDSTSYFDNQCELWHMFLQWDWLLCLFYFFSFNLDIFWIAASMSSLVLISAAVFIEPVGCYLAAWDANTHTHTHTRIWLKIDPSNAHYGAIS